MQKATRQSRTRCILAWFCRVQKQLSRVKITKVLNHVYKIFLFIIKVITRVRNCTNPPQIHQEDFEDPPILTHFLVDFEKGPKTKVAQNTHLGPMEMSIVVRNPICPLQIHQEDFKNPSPPILTHF